MVHLTVWVLLDGTVPLHGALEKPYLTRTSLLPFTTPFVLSQWLYQHCVLLRITGCMTITG